MFTKILTSSLLFLVAIGGFFMSVRLDESVTDKTIISSVSIEVSQTYAAGTGSTDEQKWLNEMIQAYNGALGIITVIVSPAIIFAGWLMSPDWTSGDLFGLREPMHKIWVVVSNITYFIYAILLIIIALATILGKENFSYKAMLPKLALGILMVPFTWWFVQWTMSLATVVTASTIGLPMEMITEDNRYINGNYIPTKYLTTSTTDKSTTQAQSLARCDGTVGEATSDCTNIQTLLRTGAGIYSPLLIYAYQVFRIQDDKKIDTTGNKIKTAGQLLNGVVMGGIMFLVFGVLTIALIVVLFVRAVKLWMYAMFSPLFTLHFVAGKELFKDSDSFSIKEFMGLCFMPAIVGLTLSFGLMVISVIQSPSQSAQPRCANPVITGDLYNPNQGTGCRLVSVFGNPENVIIRGDWYDSNEEKWIVNIIKIAGLTYVYKGVATNANISTEASSNNITGGLSAAGGIFGTLIVNIIALIFIWVAFMAAKGVNKTISKVLDPFEKLGKDVGGMAMSAPKYIPIPGTNGQSLGSLQRAGEAGMRHIESSKIKNAEEKASRVVPWAFSDIIKAGQKETINDIERNSKTGNTPIEALLKSIAPEIKEASDTRKDNVDYIIDKLRGIGDNKRWESYLLTVNDPKTREALKAVRDPNGKATEEQKRLAFNHVKSQAGTTTAGGGAANGNGVTATQQGTNASPNFEIKVTPDVKFIVNTTNHTINSAVESLSTPEGKEKIKEYMKTITEKDFKELKPSNIPNETWDKLIKEMKSEGRQFKAT